MAIAGDQGAGATPIGEACGASPASHFPEGYAMLRDGVTLLIMALIVYGIVMFVITFYRRPPR
jgi:hypothetical protein